MRKLLLQYALLLMPFFALAQNAPPVYKDLTPKIMGIVNSPFKLNDHTYVIQTNIDDENFELIAVNDKMEVLWRTTLKGYAIGAGKFKGQILAVATAGYSITKGIANPYTGFLINSQTGKVTQQKVIYTSTYQKKEWAKTFFSENDDFSLVIGLTDNGTTLPGIELPHVDTKDITVINLNEKLEAINTKHIVPDGGFVGITSNNKDDLFTFVIQADKTLQVSKYESGKTVSSASVIQDIDLNNKSDIKYNNPFAGRGTIEDNALACASSADQNVVYFAAAHKNSNRDYELTVSKFNFNNKTSQLINEPLEGKQFRTIEKNYVPFDKKLDKPMIDGGISMAVRFIAENNGTLVVAFADEFIGASMGEYFQDNSIIINGYDLNLKQKFQKIVPSLSEWQRALHADYHFENNSLYVIANTGKRSKSTIYGQLDLTTGNWLKQEILERKGIGNQEFTDRNILWFTNGFIAPYADLKNLYTYKKVIDLASYPY
jgi:hypothetical protein